MSKKDEVTGIALLYKLIEVMIPAFEAIPQILKNQERQIEQTDKIIHLRSLTLKDLAPGEVEEELAEITETVKEAAAKPAKGASAKAAAKPAAKVEPEPEPAEEEQEEEEDGLGEEEDGQEATRQDVRNMYRAETDPSKDPQYVTRVKAAFAVVRREIIGEDENGKPHLLDKLDNADAGKFLKEFKRKIAAMS